MTSQMMLSLITRLRWCLLGLFTVKLLFSFSMLYFFGQLSYFLKDFTLFYFLEKGEGKEKRGRETFVCKKYIDQLPLACPQLGTWSATQACALTGSWTGNLLVCRTMPNPLSHTSQGWNWAIKSNHTQGVGSHAPPFLGWSIYIIYSLFFFLHGNFVPFPHLCIYLCQYGLKVFTEVLFYSEL